MSKTVQPYQKELGLAKLNADLDAQTRSPRGNTSGPGFPAGASVGGKYPGGFPSGTYPYDDPPGFTWLGTNVTIAAVNASNVVQWFLYVWRKD